MAPHTDNAQMNSAAKVVVLGGAISEKPANRITIQSTSTAKRATELNYRDAKRAEVALALNQWRLE